jgi:hypothetical protein
MWLGLVAAVVGMLAGTAGAAGIYASGGTVTEVGGYRIHTYYTTGNFLFRVWDGSGNVEVLVVAGGGGGGRGGSNNGTDGGGGGGAGGVRYESAFAVSPGDYAVSVGDGGAGSTANTGNAANGSLSSLGTITALGGGCGATGGGTQAAGTGGSGGGGDDIAAELRQWHGEREGVVFVGKAQEKTPVIRTERQPQPNDGGQLSLAGQEHCDGQSVLLLSPR